MDTRTTHSTTLSFKQKGKELSQAYKIIKGLKIDCIFKHIFLYYLRKHTFEMKYSY